MKVPCPLICEDALLLMKTPCPLTFGDILLFEPVLLITEMVLNTHFPSIVRFNYNNCLPNFLIHAIEEFISFGKLIHLKQLYE